MYKDNTIASLKIFVYPQTPRSVQIHNQKIQWNVFLDLRTRFFLWLSKYSRGRQMIKIFGSRDHWIFYFGSDFCSCIKIRNFLWSIFLLCIISHWRWCDLLCARSYQTSGDPKFFVWIMIILISMIWSFWSIFNDQ